MARDVEEKVERLGDGEEGGELGEVDELGVVKSLRWWR